MQGPHGPHHFLLAPHTALHIPANNLGLLVGHKLPQTSLPHLSKPVWD